MSEAFPVVEHRQDGFLVSTDPARLDAEAIHAFLCHRSYWAEGRTLEAVRRSLANSLCYGLYQGDRQIGLARFITDYATYAYVCDVYVEDAFRGQGLGKWLMQCALAHPGLQGLRKISLVTRDAHELYRRFGFTEVEEPTRYMNLRPGNLTLDG